MDFVEVNVTASESLHEILIAQLFGLGYSSFQEFDDHFVASIESEEWDEQALTDCLAGFSDQGVTYAFKQVGRENWNEVWESNFDPVYVDGRCVIKAPFHEVSPGLEYEIVIMPKMSFGTGHHATTSQMLSMQMGLDHSAKSVLDVGTGTGILAIMALKRGAAYVVGTDIDDWCRDNSIDNLRLNGYDNIPIQLGPISDITFDRKFDIILANINKNVLLSELEEYVQLLNDDSYLLMSGFYKEDVEQLKQLGDKYGLKVQRVTEKDNWSCIQFHLDRR